MENKTLPKFELVDKYNEEVAKGQAVQSQYAQKVAEAKALVEALNYQYDNTIKAMVTSGVDNNEELDRLSKLLNDAKEELSKQQKVQTAARKVNVSTITIQDLERGLADYKNEYQQEVIAPITKELFKAKEAYFNVFLEMKRREEHFNQQAKLAMRTINPKAISLPYEVGFKSLQDANHRTITNEDLYELGQGKSPKSLQPVTKAVKDKNGHITFVPVDEE